jgi:hypothetical protein
MHRRIIWGRTVLAPRHAGGRREHMVRRTLEHAGDMVSASRTELEEGAEHRINNPALAITFIAVHAVTTNVARARGDDICPICFWEEDGQDDADADEVRGGPNRDVSLTQARANDQRFEAYHEEALQRGSATRQATAPRREVTRCSRRFAPTPMDAHAPGVMKRKS